MLSIHVHCERADAKRTTIDNVDYCLASVKREQEWGAAPAAAPSPVVFVRHKKIQNVKLKL